jgi:hypothetical protein
MPSFIGLYKLSEDYRVSNLNYPDFIRRVATDIERDAAIRDAIIVAHGNSIRDGQQNDDEYGMQRNAPDDGRRWRVVEIKMLEGAPHI